MCKGSEGIKGSAEIGKEENEEGDDTSCNILGSGLCFGAGAECEGITGS